MMRGAMPDAECPRCNATFPPSADSLMATCAKCGLVFKPHELQHAAPRRPLPEPPASISVTRQPGGLTMTMTPPRWPAIPNVILVVALVEPLWRLATYPDGPLWFGIVLLGSVWLFIGYLTLMLLFSRRVLELDATTLRSRVVPFRLGGQHHVLARSEINQVVRGRDPGRYWGYTLTVGNATRRALLMKNRNLGMIEYVAGVLGTELDIAVTRHYPRERSDS